MGEVNSLLVGDSVIGVNLRLAPLCAVRCLCFHTSMLCKLMLCVYTCPRATIAHLVKEKAWLCTLWVAGSSLTAGVVFFCYGPLARHSLPIASVGLLYCGKVNRDANE